MLIDLDTLEPEMDPVERNKLIRGFEALIKSFDMKAYESKMSVYYEVDDGFIKEDAINSLISYKQLSDEQIEKLDEDGTLDRFVEAFKEQQDCNVPENETWSSIIDELLPDVPGQKEREGA